MTGIRIEGQLNDAESSWIAAPLIAATGLGLHVVQVGTWHGGGTLTFMQKLQRNGRGHLWVIEPSRSICERMLSNLHAAAHEAVRRFAPMFGFSQEVTPLRLGEQPADFVEDGVFLDGGNNKRGQITEFKVLAPRILVGGHVFTNAGKLRKGKWLVPYSWRLNNFECELHESTGADGSPDLRRTTVIPSEP